jgi:hypothetical protein
LEEMNMAHPHVALKVLLVLRVDCMDFPLYTCLSKQWFLEEVSKATEGFFESIRFDLEVVLVDYVA